MPERSHLARWKPHQLQHWQGERSESLSLHEYKLDLIIPEAQTHSLTISSYIFQRLLKKHVCRAALFACFPYSTCCASMHQITTIVASSANCNVREIRAWHAPTSCILLCNCCFRHRSSALLKVVQLRFPDIEKTYSDLVLQHRARYKQR